MRDAGELLSDGQSAILAQGDYRSTYWRQLALGGLLQEGGSVRVPFDRGKGPLKEVHCKVRTAFASLGSATLRVRIRVDDNSSFSSPTYVYDSGAIAVADLVAGYRFPVMALPQGITQEFVEGFYTVGTADMTAGSIDLELVTQGVQTNP
jgi:hypothetical protein